MAQIRTMQAQNDTFADRLKNLRAQAGMSQDELSEKAEISKTILSRYERGVSEPKRSTLLKLADALNCSADWLSGVGLADVAKVPVTVNLPYKLHEKIEREADKQGLTVDSKILALIEYAYFAREGSTDALRSLEKLRELIEDVQTVYPDAFAKAASVQKIRESTKSENE